MAYANLDDAGADAYFNLYFYFLNAATPPTMQAQLLLFSQGLVATFPDGQPNNQPIANWLALISSQATLLGAAAPTLSDLNVAAQYIYRICLLGAYLLSVNLITNAQAAALLAAYNTYIFH